MGDIALLLWNCINVEKSIETHYQNGHYGSSMFVLFYAGTWFEYLMTILVLPPPQSIYLPQNSKCSMDRKCRQGCVTLSHMKESLGKLGSQIRNRARILITVNASCWLLWQWSFHIRKHRYHAIIIEWRLKPSHPIVFLKLGCNSSTPDIRKVTLVLTNFSFYTHSVTLYSTLRDVIVVC